MTDPPRPEVFLVHLFMRSTSDPDIAAAVICTREVSVGMLFAQARQVMREYEAADAEAMIPSRD